MTLTNYLHLSERERERVEVGEREGEKDNMGTQWKRTSK